MGKKRRTRAKSAGTPGAKPKPKTQSSDDRAATKGSAPPSPFPAGSEIRLISVPPEVAYARVEDVFEKYADKLSKITGVVTVDIGRRYQGQRPTGEFAVRVHVTKKRPEAELGDNVVPRQLDGVHVDVIERTFRACGAAASAADVAAAAASAATSRGGSRIAPAHQPERFGTLGVVAHDALESGAPRYVTCAHVVTGDRPIDDLHHGRLEVVNAQAEVVAKSFPDRWSLDQLVDAAALEPSSDGETRAWSPAMPRPRRIGRLTRQDVIDRVALLKYGAQTGMSVGEADSVQSRPIPIRMPDGSTIWARNQVQIRASDGRPCFAQLGDSGSAVLKASGMDQYDWVGIIRAVDDLGFAIACHADTLAARLNVVL